MKKTIFAVALSFLASTSFAAPVDYVIKADIRDQVGQYNTNINLNSSNYVAIKNNTKNHVVAHVVLQLCPSYFPCETKNIDISLDANQAYENSFNLSKIVSFPNRGKFDIFSITKISGEGIEEGIQKATAKLKVL